jgi:hypothetical protein
MHMAPLIWAAWVATNSVNLIKYKIPARYGGDFFLRIPVILLLRYSKFDIRYYRYAFSIPRANRYCAAAYVTITAI